MLFTWDKKSITLMLSYHLELLTLILAQASLSPDTRVSFIRVWNTSSSSVGSVCISSVCEIPQSNGAIQMSLDSTYPVPCGRSTSANRCRSIDKK